jgi:hypothetical protein
VASKNFFAPNREFVRLKIAIVFHTARGYNRARVAVLRLSDLPSHERRLRGLRP